MATLDARLLALERSINAAPLLVLSVNDRPTLDQQATIDECTRTGRRLLVFFDPGNTAWMLGLGAPPWEVQHGKS